MSDLPDDLEREVQEWQSKQTFGTGGRYPKQVAPRAMMDCPQCGADLRRKSSGVQTLGMLRGRYWRWHKCPFCKTRFVAGVPMSEAATTEDVDKMPKWYPAEMYRRIRQAEYDAQWEAKPQAEKDALRAEYRRNQRAAEQAERVAAVDAAIAEGRPFVDLPRSGSTSWGEPKPAERAIQSAAGADEEEHD